MFAEDVNPPPVQPESLETLIGMILHVWHTPVTPSEFEPTAAATPATAVPWSSQATIGLASLSLSKKSQPLVSSIQPLVSSSMRLGP